MSSVISVFFRQKSAVFEKPLPWLYCRKRKYCPESRNGRPYFNRRSPTGIFRYNGDSVYRKSAPHICAGVKHSRNKGHMAGFEKIRREHTNQHNVCAVHTAGGNGQALAVLPLPFLLRRLPISSACLSEVKKYRGTLSGNG